MGGASFDIDHEFFEAMKAIGGRRPYEINPAAILGKNADVVLTGDNAILELKTLTEDPRDTTAFNDRLANLHLKWVNAGKMPAVKGSVLLSTETLPRPLAIEFLNVLTQPVKRAVDKANLQLRETKACLDMLDAAGVLVLTNAGNPIVPPDAILNRLAHLLQPGAYRSIDHVIFMTHALPTVFPGAPRPVDVFCYPTRNGGRPINPVLVDRVRHGWFSHLAHKTGPIIALEGAPADILHNAKHVSSSRAGDRKP